MIRDMFKLRDQIVLLEVTDARHVGMNPKKYLAAARSVRTIIERELGGLAMHAFAIAELPVLQTTAENIYFDSHRCFADLDGSGTAVVARQVADAVIDRARSR